MASPISCGLARAARSASLSLVGERDAGDLAEERGHARARVAGDVAGRRARAASRAALERLAVVDAGGAPDRAPEHPERRARAQRVAGAEQDLARGRGWRCTHSTNSWRRRDLPTPAAPDDQHRARHRLGQRAGVQVVEHRQLALAADEVGRLAEQGALDLEHVALAAQERRGAVAPTSKRASSRPAVTSSRRIAPGARPAQQAHAVVDHLARHRPAPRPPRPVATTIGTSGSTARIASAQRAARAA